MIYVLDLTKPNGIFTAREFVIRDQDTVYVTEAPFTQWNKAIAAATGSLGAVNTPINRRKRWRVINVGRLWRPSQPEMPGLCILMLGFLSKACGGF